MCLSAFGQGWEDEQHVWNEEKGKWEVNNKAVVPAPQENKGRDLPNEHHEIDAEWARFLPLSVRKGKRQPTLWEVSEAQRKLWAKEVLTKRAMEEADRRRKLIAYRRATGWYDARRNANHWNAGMMLNNHINNVSRFMGGYNGSY